MFILVIGWLAAVCGASAPTISEPRRSSLRVLVIGESCLSTGSHLEAGISARLRAQSGGSASSNPEPPDTAIAAACVQALFDAAALGMVTPCTSAEASGHCRDRWP